MSQSSDADNVLVLATLTIQKVLLADGSESMTYEVSDGGITLNEMLALLERVKFDVYISSCSFVAAEDDDEEDDEGEDDTY